MSRYNDATDFYFDYKKLTESERSQFSSTANNLLGVQYLTHNKETDRRDYYFIVKHLKMFKAYFALLAYECEHYEVEKVLALTNKDGSNRLRLKKIETILLLLLRLLYQKKLEEDLAEILSITLEDIHHELERVGVFDKRVTRTDLASALRMFKRFNLIDFSNPQFDDDAMRVILYPTLLYAVRFDTIFEVEKTLNSLSSGEETYDEDTDES